MKTLCSTLCCTENLNHAVAEAQIVAASKNLFFAIRPKKLQHGSGDWWAILLCKESQLKHVETTENQPVPDLWEANSPAVEYSYY